MRNINKYGTHLFSIFVCLLIVAGWIERDEYWLSSEKGWGYALGIIGGSLMLIMLLYPLRKHWKMARKWFSIHHWFKMHMLLGVIGPLFILFHSNFQFGSLNSSIALISMLLVSSSGIVGRYAYQKIHRGLYGEQIEFSELKVAFDESKKHFSQSELLTSGLLSQLTQIEFDVNRRKPSFFKSFKSYREISKIHNELLNKTRAITKRILKNKVKLKSFVTEAKHLQTGIKQLKTMANYAVYAKVFSMWHIFHLPIFFMMLIAAIVHVVVVHMF